MSLDRLIPKIEKINLGRSLPNMEKNKGGGANQYGEFGAVESNDCTNPKVEEIVGSRDKASLLQKVAKCSNEIIEEYIQTRSK